MIKAPDWSIERLRGMETPQLKQLLANAEKRGASDIAARCEEVLAERGPATRSTAASGRATASSSTTAAKRVTRNGVSAFHFVCENDRGVSMDGERFFWTGFWIVPEDEAIRAVKAGSKLALHKSRTEPSYRQGKILDYRIAPEDAGKKRNVGIEFLVAADDVSLAWAGEGADEKGYR